MFDGRHCTTKDLKLLDAEYSKMKNAVSKNLDSFSKQLNGFLNLISRFDVGISERMKEQLKSTSDVQLIMKIIDQNVDELRQCVLVDIYEHK